MSSVEYGEYKGKKMIILKRNSQDSFPFQFGAGKGALILAHLEEIREFVEQSRKS
jgi:hypothetical protein